MKKVIGILTLVIAVIGFTAAADAATLTFSLDEMQTWGVNYGDMSLDTGFTQVVDDTLLFKVQDGASDGWHNAGIGWDFWSNPLPAKYYDLTAYDDIALTIVNPALNLNNTPNEEWFMAELYMNTGWTDTPYNQTDNRYASGLTWLAPGESVTARIDLSSVANLGYVSSIGIQVGSNWVDGGGDYYFNGNGKFKVGVKPVPEPMSILLFGTGLVGLFFKKRLF